MDIPQDPVVEEVPVGTIGMETEESQHDNDSEPVSQASVEPSPKKRKVIVDSDDEEGTLCPICFDQWTSSGAHRICALKCGHLYGHSCILRWVSSNKTCPTCKEKAKKHDIRYIFASRLIAVDNSELNVLKFQLETALEEQNQILTRSICKEHALMSQIEGYKKTIQQLNEKLQRSQPVLSQSSQKIPKMQLRLKQTIRICEQSSCRVMAVNPTVGKFVVSLKSNVGLFPGYGIKQFNIDSLNCITYTPLHKDPIRDLKFNHSNTLLLSVSLDKVAKIIDVNSSEQVGAYQGDSMLWSCCWDANNTHMFYIGEQQGAIKKFDMRYPSLEPVETHKIAGDFSPVVSIVSIPAAPGTAMPLGGFVASKLNTTCAYENKGCATGELHRFQLPGPFVSTSYNSEDGQLLISTRPSGKEPNAKHYVCTIGEGVRENIVHVFNGGVMQKNLSRTCFVKNAGSLCVATQQVGCVVLWSVNDGTMVTAVKRHSPVIDLMPLCNTDGNHLLALSEDKLNFYKFCDV